MKSCDVPGVPVVSYRRESVTVTRFVVLSFARRTSNAYFLVTGEN
jgi:hypothetical protein